MPLSGIPASCPSIDHAATIKSELKRYQPLRKHRYASVNVLVLTWKIGDDFFAADAAKIAHVFEVSFNYAVCHYEIPSERPQSELNLRVSGFINAFGGEENLIIVYYGGHGSSSPPNETTCTWAALSQGGPTLDWSIIQPQFLGANCDVIILLDCCYAGQAVRASSSHSVEVLAAADKDMWTPVGIHKWPSFTNVLVREMQSLLEKNGSLTLLEVYNQMIGVKAGLLRQPFYGSVAPESHPDIVQLVKWSPRDMALDISTTEEFDDQSEKAILQLRLRLLGPLDDPTTGAFIRWATKQAPPFIENIEFDQILSDAQVAGSMASQLMKPDSADPDCSRSILSEKASSELLHRARTLKESIILPKPGEMNNMELYQVLVRIKQDSEDLMSFTKSCITSVGPQVLHRMKDSDLSAMQDLKSRISLRLLLLGGQNENHPIRVSFANQSTANQRLRFGRLAQTPVLVEYSYPTDDDTNAVLRLENQVARVAALHAEAKTSAFRTMHGLGYVSEALHGPRFGSVYQLPPHAASGHPGDIIYSTLSDAIRTVKNVPLEIRCSLAKTLCDATLHLHSIGWWHKALKSDNVIFFRGGHPDGQAQKPEAPLNFENPYIVGFDCSRPADAETWTATDFVYENNLYRHPDRWGRPRQFERHHELYALGILLLEIGSWRVVPAMGINPQSVKDPEKIRSYFLSIIDGKLAHAAGSQYASVVRKCIEKRDWMTYEDWQYVAVFRREILAPLCE